MLVRCFRTNYVFTHVVPCKGMDDERYFAIVICDDDLWLGHTELILKNDNEIALKALVTYTLEVVRVTARAIALGLAGDAGSPATASRISSETSPGYDSQANGGTEAGVMFIRGLYVCGAGR